MTGSGTGRGTAPDLVDPDERTVILTRRRFVRRQRARRWLVWRRIALAALAVGAVGTLVWLVYFSSALAVRGVQVQGTSVLEPDEVRRAAQVPLHGPLATVDLDAVRARVEDLAAVESAEVSRGWPDRVRIDVTERRAVAVVERAGSFSALDPAGVLFRTYPRRPTGLPVVRASTTTSSDALAEAARVVDALPSAIARRVQAVDVRSVDAITFSLTGGGTVRWGSGEESADKAAVLAVLLRTPAREYDVTVPGRPTLRP